MTDPAEPAESADPAEPADPAANPPLNREQRRAAKFHRHAKGRQDNLLSERANNSGFLTTPPAPTADAVPDESHAEGAFESGPGSGGATEGADRAQHHEGVHLGNPSKS